MSEFVVGRIVEKAYAKINLTLKVIGRRSDGYHEIDSLVVFADVGDLVSVEAADVSTCTDLSADFIPLHSFSEIDLAVSGAYGGAIEGKNLVATVADSLLRDISAAAGVINVAGGSGALRVMLEKILPVAAGVGGGSADAAALIRLFQRLGFVDFNDGQISEFGKRFGADVPVCVYSQPAFMRGIGEIIEPLGQLPLMGIVLVNPRVSVSTGAVFSALNAPAITDQMVYLTADGGAVSDAVANGVSGCALGADQELGTMDAVVNYMKQVPNDLSIPAQSLVPQIGDVLLAIEELQACRIARLSGSGATCFGLFEDEVAARNAALVLSTRFPDWWVMPSVIRSF